MSTIKLQANLLIILLITTLALSSSSCKREVEDRLPGDWNYTETGTNTVDYNANSNTEEFNNTGTATFIDDGTGSFTIGTTVSVITWEVSGDTINITEEGKSISYFITNNEKSLQEWEAKYIETGDDFNFTSEIKLTLTQ